MLNAYDEIIPGGEASAPPTGANPYDEIIGHATENTASTVQNNLYRAQDTDPDTYAKALQMGQSLGLHPDTVVDQLPDLEKQKQLVTQQEQAARESSLTQFLTNDINAKIAKDDLDKLGTISGMIKAIQGGWDQASLEYELGWIKTREQMHMPGEGDEQRRAEIEGQLQGMPQYPGVAGYLQKATAFGRGLEKSAEVAVPPAAGAALIGAAVTPEVGGVGAVPAFAGMFTSALAVDFARDAAARTYDATGKLKTDTGDPIPEPVRQLSAAVAGVGTYFLGKVGGTEVSEATRAGVQSLFTHTLEEAVTRPTVARAMAQFAANMGEAGLKGAALNAMMTTAGTIGEQTARLLTPNMSTILSDPAQQEQFKASLINSIVDGLTLFPLMELPGAAMGFMGDTLRARQASIDVQNLTDLANGIGESKTRARDQGTFTDFMRSQVDGTPLEHMAINGDALMQLYQRSGVDPFSLDKSDDPLLGWLPDRDQQLREATACKGDVIVPTSEFLSRMAGTPAFSELLPDIRVRPDGFTMREASDPEVIHARLTNFANQVRTFQANWAEQAAQQEPAQRVFNDVYDQLRAVDRPTNVAAAEAAVMAARYETRAARNAGAYADAWDAYQKSGLKIRKGEASEGLEQAEKVSRTIPTSEALAEKPIPLKDITEYDDLQKEAARRAWAEVEKEHGKQVRISEKQLRDQGEGLHSELPSTQVLETIRKTGLKRSSLDDYDQDTITQLVRKYPGLIRKDGTALLDELAHDHGYESEDALVQDLLGAEKKGDFLDRYAEDAKRTWGLQLGLSPEEWQSRLLEKEREVFAELTRSAPTARLEAIRKRMERSPRAALALPAEGYGTGPHLLNLFAARDRSSFLHEGSHLFLEELIHDASLPDAPDQVKTDLQAVKDWFATHSGTANGQILAAKRKAESDLALHPDDPQLEARAEVFRKADALLAADPEYLQKFAQTLGADLDPQLRMALLTPFHELFARHAEGYFMEGKAPSPGLQGAFDSFRSWLKSIYERVAGKGRQLLGLSQAAGFGVDVSPEVRGVMDRLLATDDQIELVRQKQRLGRMFDSAQKAGFTTAEFAHYNDLVAKARTEARNRVQSEALQELEKQKSEAWEAKDAEIRPGIEAQINSRPDLQALHYLRTGKQLGEEGEAGAKVALSKDALVRLVGEKALKDLPHGLYRIEGGADPQEVGEMFGYRSGTDLAHDLLSLEAQRRDLRARGITDDLRQHMIDEAVQAKLQEHFGDMMVDGSMPGKAMDAVHNDYSNQALAMELRGLIRQAGMTRPLYGPAYDAKGWAQNEIGNHRVSDVLNLSRFARDEAKAAEAADRAMLKGDLATAIQQKQAQILNHALYTEAAKAKDNLEKLTTAAAKYAKKRTLKGMDQGALDQIHNLLERFGLKNQTPDYLNRDTLSNWVQQVRGAYGDVAVPDSLFDQTLPFNYKDLTVSQMQDLQTAVKSISYIGRQLNKITVAGKKVEFEAARDDLVRSAFANTKAVKDIPLERNPNIVQGNFGEKLKARWTNAKGALRGLDSSLLKVEQICDWLDGKDSNGAWNNTIFRRATEREAWENQWRKTMADGIRSLQDLYPEGEQKKLSQYLPDIPELKDNQTGAPLRITHSELVSMALNWGNASNRGKMLRGEGWRAEAVQGVFDRYMSKADWDFTQGVWDLLEKMRPEIAAREKRMTGVEPIWIDALPVDTPHGQYRGGYYPMSYDPARAGDAMDRLIENAERLLDTSRAGRPTTDKGYTMERAERYSRPVMLSLDVLPRHIDTVVRDLAWREYVFDMVRLFKDPAIRDAMNRTVGSEYQQQLIPWLKGLCSDRTYDPNGLSFWDQVAHRARINTTIVGLGFRASTMLVHGMTAASNSVGELGAKWMGVGASKFFGTPDKMAAARDFVYARSNEMRTRMDNVDRDIRDGLREMLDKKGVLDPVKRYAYYGVAMLDMASALPTWIGAYERAMHEGMTEPDAIYAADKSVRNAHGGGGAKDMAAVQRGSETQKLFTMFYSFWSHFYNRQRDLGRSGTAAVQDITSGNVKQGAKDFAAVLARSWWYFIVPQIIHGIIKSGAPGDEESWLGWAAKEVGLGLFSGVPVVRDVANAWGGGHDFKVTPAASIYDAFTSTKKDVSNLITGEKDVSAHWLKHALDTTGYAFGLPTGQAGTALQYLWDVWDGQQNPEDIADFSKGLVFGTHKKR